jgi:asparagine synthetase B (glutamine-hydrolysing)
MLSGGLDSTLLAAYLARSGYEIVAITEGLSSDNEMRCAKQVAETLGFEHHQFKISYNDYPLYSELTATWQHLSEGFTGFMLWGFSKHLRKETPHVITGFAGDGVLGTLVDWSLMNPNGISSFKTLFEKINEKAFTPTALRKLLKKEYSEDLILKILHEIKRLHESYPGVDFQKTWGFGLHQRIRYHDLSGIWPISFGAWPILPYTDHRILEVVGGFPLKSLANRQVERELLRTKFPKLAKLSLAGYTMNTVPIERGLSHKVQQLIYGSGARSLRNRLAIRLRGEKRYWPRRFHFDSPEYRIIRTEAEPYIHLTEEFFRKEALHKLMPRADASYSTVRQKMKSHGLTETLSYGIIIGLALWLKNHRKAITNLRQ